MKLDLQKLVLPLAHFELRVDAVLTGRMTAVFGPSGSGKSSLIEIIAGLRRPREGLVRLDEHVLTDVARRTFVVPERRHIAYVPQDGALFPHLSVRRNLLYSRPEPRPADHKLGLDHVTEVLGLGGLLDRSPQTLSGGERQRVALGRALLAAPRLLLLDEPLAGLDLALKERLLPYLRHVRDEFGIPMIFITHAADEVMALCDEALFLERGAVRAQGAPSDLFVMDGRPHYRPR